MIMMKKMHSTALFILFTIIILSGLYYVQYPTKVDKVSLEMELEKFEDNIDIEIQKIEVIGNKIIALYTYHDGIGYGMFNKGINGRCLLESSHRDIGGITFQEGFINTNKGQFKFFTGKNYDGQIKLIEFASESGKRLAFDISNEDYFIIAINNTEGVFSFLRFDLFDENGRSIREEIIQKYLIYNSRGRVKAKMERALFNFWYLFVVLVSVCSFG